MPGNYRWCQTGFSVALKHVADSQLYKGLASPHLLAHKSRPLVVAWSSSLMSGHCIQGPLYADSRTKHQSNGTVLGLG